MLLLCIASHRNIMARLSLAYLAALRGVFCVDARVIAQQAFVGGAPSASRAISKGRVRMPSWLPVAAQRCVEPSLHMRQRDAQPLLAVRDVIG